MRRGPGIVCALIALVVFVGRRDRLAPIGEHWAIGHALTSKNQTLYRVGAHPFAQRTRVDRLVTSYRFYAPDCLLYTTKRVKYAYIYAVCGERNPVIVAGSAFEFGKYGLEMSREPDSTRNPDIRVGSRIPIGFIKRTARYSADFHPEWYEREETHKHILAARQYRELVDVDALEVGDHAVLHEAVASGNVLGTERLITYGVHLDVPDRNGLTPLMVAALERTAENDEMARLLIGAGADLDAQSNTGMTALMFAVRSGSIEVARYMRLAGADTTLRNKTGRTAGQMTAVR